MENEIKSAEYIYTCPICGRKHKQTIFIEGSWHCDLCGGFHYSYEYRIEIRELLKKPLYRAVFAAYIRDHWNKTHQAADINPQMIERVLKDRGVLK